MGRTENDTWDLASSVGATATMVAASRARATRAALIDDPLAEPLVRAGGIDFFIRWASDELRPEDVDLPDAPWGMQRMTDQQAARTRYIDAFFVAAQHDGMPAGIRQVVILTSGLDTRGYRPPWAGGNDGLRDRRGASLRFQDHRTCRELLLHGGAAPAGGHT